MEKILLDVGGTFIKCFDGREIPVNSDGTRDEIVAAFRTAIFGNTSATSRDVQICAAMPGPFDYATGQFLMKHKFASVYGERFQEIVGVEDCRFIHDVNCMLLGEMLGGNGRPYGRVAMIALGTGLGFGMSIDGKILKNGLGSPAVSIFNRPYKDGVLEDYASKRGVWKIYGDDSIPVKEIAQKAAGGDQRALDAFKTMGDIIGEAISPIMKEYGMECLLLGGQISRSWKLFAPAMEARMRSLGLDLNISPVSDFDNATFNGLKTL